MNHEQNHTSDNQTDDRGRSLAEAQQARSAISQDIRAIGEKLSPERLKDVAKETASEAKQVAAEALDELGDAAKDKISDLRNVAVDSLTETYEEVRDGVSNAGRATAEFVARNAVPLALIGIGATWLWTQNRNSGSRVSYSSATNGGRRARSMTAEASRSVRHAGQEMKGGFSRGGQRAKEQVQRAERALGEAGTQARDFATQEFDRARTQSVAFARENPVLVSTLALAAGVGVGLLLPHTEREDELMGEARDRLLETAKGAAHELADATKDAAQSVGSSLTGAS